MKVRTWLALTLAGAGLFARAELAVSGGEIRPGEWNSRFVAAKEYAEAHNTPMLAIWSSTGCGWCRLLREACQNAEFVRWQNERKLVMVACHDKDQPDDYACWQFIRNETGAFPYVGIYWPKQNGASVKVLFSGRASYFPNKTSNTLYGRLIDSVEDAIEGWDPTRPAYVGGEFLATNTPSACLEADVGTTFVRVPLVRQPNACGVAAVNRLTVTYPNGRTASHEVRWAAGDRTNMATRIELPAGTFSAAGQEIGLRLQDDKGQEVSRSVIAYAPDRENSPKNPLWIGERSAETLLFGEWTMDLDVATNKTAATAGAAHTLVLIGGSTWCPDCVKTDAYLIDTPQFKTWARDNRISCVAIDVPKMNKDTPSLLTYDPVVTSDRYVTSTTPHQDRVQAGAGYLSRKMIEPAAAAAVAARNHHLLYDSTLQGGLCRPEKMQNTFKTGIPCLILLRKDGTVAGRLDQFNDVSPDRFNPAHIDRLNELLAASEDLNEESNADWSSTRMSIAVPGSASGTLSAMDLTDVFRIEDVRNGYSHRFALTGDGESGEEDVCASIIRVKDGAAEVVKSATGALADGVSVQSVLETASGARYYLKLEALAGSEAFSIDREGNSTRSYSVTSRSVPNPGRISFVQEAQTLAENGDGGSVRVRRAGGSSGACTVLLAVDASSTASVGRYALDAQTVTWADGEQGEKSVRFRTILNSTFEGRQTVVLALQTVSGAECAADLDSGTHVVTIMDSDTPCFARSQYEVDTYLSVEDSVEFDLYNLEAGSVQVKKVEGKGLPSGMKLKVVDGKAVLSGVPKKAGTYTVAYVVRNGRVTGSERTTLTINVSDPSDRNPFMGQRRKAVVPLMIQLGGGKVLAGELTVSITSAGAISARYAGTESAKVSFKGTWNSFDAETGVAASAMVARNGGTLGLELHPDGTLRVRLAGVASALSEEDAAVTFAGVAGDVMADLKSAFDGYYTVTLPVRTSAPTMLPTGTGYLTLTIKSGGVRYAGLAANGTKLSGSGTLQGNSEEVAALGVFKRLSKDVFGIPMEIRKNASETCTDIERLQVINTADGEIAYCLHRENGVSAMSVADVFGGYYLQDKSPDAICGIFGIDPLLALTFGVNQYAAGDEGVITSAPAALMRADDKGFAFESMGVVSSFKFTRKTGLFSGKAKVGFANGRTVSGTFKGVLLPGWFGQCDECGEPVPGGLVTRPFASGLFWFKGSVGGKRVTRSLSVDIDSYVAE